jgi:hypothetical protein
MRPVGIAAASNPSIGVVVGRVPAEPRVVRNLIARVTAREGQRTTVAPQWHQIRSTASLIVGTVRVSPMTVRFLIVSPYLQDLVW